MPSSVGVCVLKNLRGTDIIRVERSAPPSSRPILRLTGRSAERAAEIGAVAVSVSLTHDDANAMAVVVLEGGADSKP